MRCWKKILCAVLSLLLCATAAGATDTKTFDFSALESMEGYEKDAFDKTESCLAAVYGRTLPWGITVQGDTVDHHLIAVALSVIRSDAPCEEAQFLTGETVYAFDLSSQVEMGLENTGIILTESSLEFFEALAEAEEVSIRVTSDGDEYDDTYSKENLQPVQELLKITLSQDPLSCFNAEGLEMVALVENLHFQEMEIR